ncbi:MAG: DNA/RNA nuclease SfsA [Spirochaetes bacterium]|nr:DNA/RNA nuclease SfsA [Spirochaetota bacterium]
MKWPSLIGGTLVKRYKRFLADVRLDDGRVVTAHCPNSGSMRQCQEPGAPVRLSISQNAKRKLPFTWELIHHGNTWIVVNTGRANQLARETLELGAFPPLAGLHGIKAEVPYGESRADFMAMDAAGRRTWIEVKSVSLLDDGGHYSFPDAVTLRGQKHLEELMRVVREGDRGVLWFLLMRGDGRGFRPADSIDPEYSRLCAQALERGVEIHVGHCRIDEKEIVVDGVEKPVIIP